MTFTTELIEAAREYWRNTLDLNPDAGILTTLEEFFEDRPGSLPTKIELEKFAFEILTTTCRK